MTDASALLAIGRPSPGKDVVGNVVQLGAERVLNDLGGSIALVAVDGSFQQVTHVCHSLFGLPVHCRSSRIPDLEPMIDAAGAIRRAEAFRHDTFTAERAGVIGEWLQTEARFLA